MKRFHHGRRVALLALEEEQRLLALSTVDTTMLAASAVTLVGLAALAWVFWPRQDPSLDGPDVGPSDDTGPPSPQPPPPVDAPPPPPPPVDAPAPPPPVTATPPTPVPVAVSAPAPGPIPMPPGNGLILDSVRSTWSKWSEDFEGRTPTMYRDVAVQGYVTSGVGNLMDPVSMALPLAWLKPDGSRASQAEIIADWNRVKAMPKGLWWTKYQTPDALHLGDDQIDALVLKQLDANAVALQRFFPDFASFPEGAQRAILSVAWAVGAGFPLKFPKAAAAIRAHDWAKAADEAVISTTGNAGVIKRNAANRAAFLDAAAHSNDGASA